MRIKKIEIHGFKSFCDRTLLTFEDALTGVVGPNGCGKSNVVDAIRWCMGEQSARQLRGRSMDDVIFAGSEARGPMGLAEVSIAFEDVAGHVPEQYAHLPEVVVSRRLYRDGTSEYLINKVAARLRDVVDVFLGTGVGKAAYSIIEQGRVGWLVNARPEERRTVIEEAAGITRYRLTRAATERRLEQTRDNLARLGDLLREKESHLGSLRRQAAKARRYRAYREEQRDLELWQATQEYLRAQVELSVVEEAAAASRARRDALRADVGAREAALDADRLRLSELDRALAGMREQASAREWEAKLDEQTAADKTREAAGLCESAQRREGELDRERREAAALAAALAEAGERAAGAHEAERAARAEAEAGALALDQARLDLAGAREALDAARERAEAARGRATRAEAAIASLGARREVLGERRERLAAERAEAERSAAGQRAEAEALRAHAAELRASRDGVGEQRRLCAARLADARDLVSRTEVQLDTVREQHHRARSKLDSLREIQQSYEGMQRGVRAVMQEWSGPGKERVRGLLADVVEAPPRYEAALEAALGDRIGSVIVEDPRHGAEAVEYLKRGGQGRGSFVPLHLRAPAECGAPPARGEGVCGEMLDLVRVPEDYRPIARHLLGQVTVVEDLPRAIALWSQDGEGGRTLVTLDGEVLDRAGVLAGGSRDDAGVLARRREIRELTEWVAALQAQLDEALRAHVAARAELSALERRVEALSAEGQDRAVATAEADKDLERVAAAATAAADRAARAAAESAAIEADLGAIESERAAAAAALAAAHQDAGREQRAVDELRGRVDDLAAREQQAARAHADQRDRLGRAEAGLAAAERERDLCAGREREARGRAESLAREAAGERERAETLSAEAAALRDGIGPKLAELSRLRERIERDGAAWEALREAIESADQALRALRGELESLGDEVAGLEVRGADLRNARAAVLSHVRDRWGVGLLEEIGDFHLRPLFGEEQAARRDELARLIERMGSPSLESIEEAEGLEREVEAMRAQQADLSQAVEDLQQAIHRINRDCRKRFRETFDAVNERFQEVFPRLFLGGRARLVLTGEDVLECGVDIEAQPPGKKLQSVQLLSGGEKAVTALALLFAVFLHRPSPFCLLDEVDAPLDDANVARFNELVRLMSERSQLVLITHNKVTMECVDKLYGVTMEEPGVSKIVSVNLKRARDAA